MKKPRSAADRYLWHRADAKHIWFRMAVPKEFHAIAGKKLVQESLGTSDKRAAAIKAGQRRAALFASWGASDGQISRPPTLDPKAVAVAAGYDELLSELSRLRKNWPRDDAGYAASANAITARLRQWSRSLQDGDLQAWEGIAPGVIARHGLDLKPDSAEYREFVAMLAEASIDAAGTFARLNEGELDAGPRAAVVRQVKDDAERRAKVGETILELFERWSSDRLAKGQKRADTVAQDRKAIEQFAEFVGKDRDVRSVTAIEVAEYRDVLRQLPPKWRSHGKLKGLGMRAAAARARELALPESAFTSVNKHLSTISPLYKWLAGQPAWAGLQNPCGGLFHDKVKGKNRRPSFSTAQLNQMVQSPLFTGFLADGREHLPGSQHADDWRKWIPLVALFTGARIGEIAQLRVGDVRQERGAWFVHIRHDEENGLTTKSGRSRPAALHATLIKIGFLAFHERQVAKANGDPTAQLFPELQANSRGQISAVPSRWWREYLTAIGLKAGSDGFGAHSFRHTLADRLRSEVELLDDQIEVCLGHNQKTVTAGYGELSQGTVTMFKGWMDALKFDGVDFSHIAP